MKRGILFSTAVICVLFLLPQAIHASYVLPYPSYMPGNKMYRITRIIDRIKAPFYFGNLSSYTYHLSLSDKYLVEAKTLFEYKQYLLAADALQRSDAQFAAIPPFLSGAKKEGKDIRMYMSQYAYAAQEHERVLTGLMNILPESFEWSPEKSASTTLSLRDMIAASVTVRQKNVLLVK